MSFNSTKTLLSDICETDFRNTIQTSCSLVSRMRLENCQGTVVGVIHDQVLVNYDGDGVIFFKEVLLRAYKVDDIVIFTANEATTVDIEVSDQIAATARFDVKWKGTEIKFVKAARTLKGGGVILKIDPQGQFMFIDWKLSATTPALVKMDNVHTSTNILCPKIKIKPKCENINDMFKHGQRVQYYAKEQAPSRFGVCWKAVIVTDMEHDLIAEEMGNRTLYNAIIRTEMKKLKKDDVVLTKRRSTDSGPSSSSSSTSNGPQASISANQLLFEKPPNVEGYDFYDCSLNACQARFKAFADNFRAQNPESILAKPQLEGLLQLQYLSHVEEQMSIIRAATTV